jgi:hypothetical protein
MRLAEIVVQDGADTQAVHRVHPLKLKNERTAMTTNMLLPLLRRLLVFSAVISALTLGACAHHGAAHTTGPSTPIAEADILAAQKAWGDALVQISLTYEREGAARAKEVARAVIDQAYGYNFGPVLFKPTLTHGAQTFRTTREGALAYFVGGDPAYPSDDGFALKHWRKVEMRNMPIQSQGNTAQVMSKVRITDRAGQVTEVDKTWGYRRDSEGKLRIVIHHSSLARSN